MGEDCIAEDSWAVLRAVGGQQQRKVRNTAERIGMSGVKVVYVAQRKLGIVGLPIWFSKAGSGSSLFFSVLCSLYQLRDPP